MKIHVLRFHQDDPKKCTAAKLVKFKIASDVKFTKSTNLVLHPFSEKVLIPRDKRKINSIVGIDCSWTFADKTFEKIFVGINRKLPPLLAGNPVNYSKLNKLTTVEAISASLFILGFSSQAVDLLGKFNWGHTFYELNKNLLENYSKAESETQIISIAKDYGLAD